MKDDKKTREQLVHELLELRTQNAELKKAITGSILIERTIDESYRYAESIVETVREPLLVMNSDLKIISANRNFYIAFKVKPGETIGHFIYDLGNKQWDIPKLRELLEDILPENKAFDGFEVDHIFKDIGHKIMLLNARQIYRKDIDSKIILLAIEDITERREIENGLEKPRKELAAAKISEDETREYAGSIINTIREPLIALDHDLRVVSANRSFYEFFKVKPEETVGQLIYDLGNKQWDIPKLRELLETILPEKTTFDNYEVEHDFATIGRRMMLLNARQIKRVLGKERIILLAIEDITEHKRLESLLTESEERYRSLFETANDGIVLLEKREGRITDANPAIEKLLGYTKKEMVGNKPQDIGVLLNMGNIKTILQTLDKNGIINYNDVPIKTKSGQLIDTDIYLVGRAMLVQCNIRDITDRKKAEGTIHEVTERLHLATASAKAGVWDWNLQMNEMIWDDRMFELYGLTHENFPGGVEAWKQGLHPDDSVRAIEDCEAALRGDHDFHTEFRVLRPDKTVIHIKADAIVLRDDAGKPLHMIGLNIDITGHKQTEVALQESEKKYRLIFENTPLGNFFFDEKGVIVECNNIFVNIIGSTREALIGLNMLNLPDKKMVLTVREALSGGIGVYEDLYRSATAKKVTPMRALFAPMISEGGVVSGGVGIIEDITARKRAENDLKVSETNLRMILDSVDNAIFIYTETGKIIDVNSKMLEMYGVSRAEVYSMTIEEDFSTQENPLNELPGIWESVMKGEDRLFEWQARRPHDGISFNVEVFLRKIKLSHGDFILAAVRDITERKRAGEEKTNLEKQLLQSHKMEAIGTLAGGIAHDFNNILAIINGYTEMAMDKNQNENVEQDLQEILNGSQRAKNLVKQILTFSRQDDHEKKPLDIKVLLKEAIKFLRSSIPTTIEINQHLTEESCNIIADPTQMHQVIMNLCTNASYAMKEREGTLKIELANVELAKDEIPNHPDLQTGHYVQLTVSDTGHGIDPALIQRIFDPFFTTKSVDEGTGLGLSVVYGIVKSHGGIINVYSEPDKGAAFHVYLPRITYGEDMKVDRRKPVTGGTERILFVDDEPALVNLGKRMLSSLGYYATGVKSSVEALDLFLANPESFDLVITDMTLPKMTGIDLSRKLLQIRPNIPIILCSGIKDPDTESQVKSLGIKAYIMKPLTKRELSLVVRDTLDGQKKQAA